MLRDKLTHFSQLKGNYLQLKQLNDFLLLHKNNILLILGNHSSGKTSIYNILSYQNVFEILYIDHKSHESFETLITNFTNFKSIHMMFIQKQQKPKLIFVDNVDVILSIDKNIINILHNLKCTAILTCTPYEEKKLSSFKKTFHSTIHLQSLNYKDCFQICIQLLNTSDIDTDTIDMDRLLKLVKINNSDFKKIFMQIDDVKIKNEEIVLLDNYNDHKDKHNTFNIISNIYNTKCDSNRLHNYLDKDGMLLVSLLHENITAYKIPTKYIDQMLLTYRSLCFGDFVEKFTYMHCDWYSPLTYSSLYYRMRMVNQTFVDLKQIVPTYKYTQQFTKLSSQVSVKKKILLLEYKLYNDYLFHILNHYMKHPTKNKNISELLIKYKKDWLLNNL